jgi:putative phosphoribosyl transferase
MTAIAVERSAATGSVPVRIPVESMLLTGKLAVPENARGLVIVANGDGDHIYDRGNQEVASYLADSGFATLLIDLLTPLERVEDAETSALRFDQALLARRLIKLTVWARSQAPLRDLRIGYFASGPCADAAVAAAGVSRLARAVVCRGAQVDADAIPAGGCGDVLFLVGARDTAHTRANREAVAQLPASATLYVVPDAGHALEEPHARLRVSHLAEDWFAWTLDPQLFDRNNFVC